MAGKANIYFLKIKQDVLRCKLLGLLCYLFEDTIFSRANKFKFYDVARHFGSNNANVMLHF